MARYLVNRWSSPWEWGIDEVPDDIPLGPLPDEPAVVFETFTEAKDWLIDQTNSWVQGFADDMREIRALRKYHVDPADSHRIKELRKKTQK